MFKVKIFLIVVVAIAFGSTIYFLDTWAQDTSTVSLDNNQLFIIPLLNYIGSGLGYGDDITQRVGDDTGGKWGVITIYEKGNHNMFVVLPVVGGLFSPNSAPYTWSLDDPTIGTLKPLYKGTAVEVIPQKEGETMLRARDRKGLQGAVLIQTSYFSPITREMKSRTEELIGKEK